jgi:hypothetical protein
MRLFSVVYGIILHNLKLMYKDTVEFMKFHARANLIDFEDHDNDDDDDGDDDDADGNVEGVETSNDHMDGGDGGVDTSSGEEERNEVVAETENGILEMIESKLKLLNRRGRVTGFPFVCYNKKKTFLVEYVAITLLRQQNSATNENVIEKVYEVDMSYTIVKGCPDKDRIFREEFTKGQEILEWIMKILWFYDLCPECYGLMNNEGTDENTEKTKNKCNRCKPYLMLTDYAQKKEWLKGEDIKECCICFDPVYFSQLQCGHYIHRKCMLQSNPFDYFDEKINSLLVLRCPLCRKMLSIRDKMSIFNVSLDCVEKIMRDT